MNMRVLISSFLLMCSLGLFAQSDLFKSNKQLNTWNIGSDFEIIQFYGDIKQYDWYPAKIKGSFNELRIGGNINITKMINNNYGFSTSLSKGGFAGLRTRRGNCNNCTPGENPLLDTMSIKFKADYWMADASLVYNLSNLNIKTKNAFDKKWILFGEVGFGLIAFRSLQTHLNSDVLVTARGYIDTIGISSENLNKKNRQVESVFKLGVMSKYKISKKIDLTASLRYYQSFSDMLDGSLISGRDVNGAKNDKFITISFGFKYKLGSKKQSSEWYSPLDKMYHSQKRVNKQIQGLTKDSDKDGVADQFDSDSETPQGVAVDGKGVALDVDMDGVSDYLDDDPFTSKGVPVDEFGREYDSDNDGIPNSKDLQLNTKEGAIVNYQGVSLTNINSSTSNFLPSVYFKSGSTEIQYDDLKKLAIVAKTLRDNPKINVLVVGHADSYGDVYTNDKLGLSRANNVIDHLVNVYDLDRSRFLAETKGETMPLAITPAIKVELEGRGITFSDYLSEINRRVDFQINE